MIQRTATLFVSAAMRQMMARRAQSKMPSVATIACYNRVYWVAVANQQQQPARLYGSGKKKGSKRSKRVNEEPEASDEASADEMTLDMDKVAAQMHNDIERFANELKAMRAGRANPAMLDHIRVLLKGGSAILSDLAMVTVKDAHNLLVIPNDADNQKAIETSIRNSGLGLNPRIDKNAVVVPVPKTTKETREKLLKSLGSMAEHARVNVRKHRQDAMKRLKSDSKSGMAKDDVKAWEKGIQEATDKQITRIEELLKAKTHEVERA